VAPAISYQSNVYPSPESIVSLAPDLAGLQGPNGSMVPGESLGPGIVKRVDQEGRVCVYWVEAGFDSCLDPADVTSPGHDAHLVSVYHHTRDGRARLHRHMVVTGVGLEHNWTVERWPSHVVRVIRNLDRAAWTFTFNWVFSKIEVWWPQPPDDDDAEALMVADVAAKDKK
jgi:hypothetical protein